MERERRREREREREEAGKQAAKLYENLHNCSIDSFTTLVGLRFPCAKAKSGYVMSCWKLESCQFSYLRHLLHLGLDSPILYSSHSSSSSSLFTLPTFNNTTPSKLSSWHPIFTTFTQKNRLLSSFLPSFLPLLQALFTILQLPIPLFLLLQTPILRLPINMRSVQFFFLKLS